HLQQLEMMLSKQKPQWAERIHTALIVAGGKESFGQLARVLNDNKELCPKTLKRYLGCFGWESLSATVDLLGELEFASHRLAVCDYLSGAGPQYVDIIAKGIYDRHWFVVRNTVSILARIGGEKPLSYLEKAICHHEARVRIEVAKGLLDTITEGNRDILAELVWDGDETVSKTVIEGILKHRDDTALDIIKEVINDDRFAMLSDLDQQMFLVSFSRLAGERAVGYLTKLISEWRLMPSRFEEFYQQAAFVALAHNRSKAAEAVLLRYGRSLRKKIRRLAAQALALRREIIYGE
ncbi:MAG: HEAT repeat domain-containing protein, partial [Candidatus Zixiibacteriota bacterium]